MISILCDAHSRISIAEKVLSAWPKISVSLIGRGTIYFLSSHIFLLSLLSPFQVWKQDDGTDNLIPGDLSLESVNQSIRGYPLPPGRRKFDLIGATNGLFTVSSFSSFQL